MQNFVLLVALAAGIAARPDVGLVYNYKPPSTNYGVPSGPAIPSGSYIPSAPSTQFQTPIQNSYQASFNGLTTLDQGAITTDFNQLGSSQQGFGSQSQYELGQSQQGSVHTQFGQTQQSFAQGQQSFGQGFLQANLGPAEVTKHVYFFEAPEEPSVARTHVKVPPPRKNIKLIFIKAPSYEQSGQIIAPQQQTEEKTLVYVLVKKPDDAQDINIPPPPPLAPSKPEVYFIKYKTQQEAEAKITGTLQGSQGADTAAISLQSQGALINSIGHDSSKSTGGVTIDNFGSGNIDTRTNDLYEPPLSAAVSSGASSFSQSGASSSVSGASVSSSGGSVLAGSSAVLSSGSSMQGGSSSVLSGSSSVQGGSSSVQSSGIPVLPDVDSSQVSGGQTAYSQPNNGYQY